MPLAGVVAGLALAAILLLAECLLLRRRGLRAGRHTVDDDFGDAAAGYHKEPPGWPVDDWPPEGEEDEDTCPECNAVLIYGARTDERDEEPPEAGSEQSRAGTPR